jgi:hypothetical protein
MSIITKMLKQDCVYWPLASSESGGRSFDNYGQPVLSEPIEIKCRWEDVSEEFITSDGTKLMSKAKVYVDRDVDKGGVLMLGVLDDITDSENVKENEGAWEIKRFDKLPNFRATEFLRTAFL